MPVFCMEIFRFQAGVHTPKIRSSCGPAPDWPWRHLKYCTMRSTLLYSTPPVIVLISILMY